MYHSPNTTHQMPLTTSIGVMLNSLDADRMHAFAVAARLGFRVVHTSALPERGLAGPERLHYLSAARASGLAIASMFVGFDGQSYADIPTIRRTVGLVIPERREHRMEVALQYSDLAKELDVASLSAHIGFLPPVGSQEYPSLVETMRTIVDYCAKNGQTFHLETGQESADELLQFIAAADRSSLGVNFDPANFLLYGSDHPLSALDKLARLVRGVHCKDGLRPKEPGILGAEVPIGQGEVNFPQFLRKLHAHGYRGPLVIERETGPNAVADVVAARDYLVQLLGEL